jgi:Neuraminidase (sialidase)
MRKILLNFVLFGCIAWAADPPFRGATVLPWLPPARGNPRNTEGSFVTLKDGRLFFAYSHFTGGGGDNDAASIAGRYSKDRGKTWSADTPVVNKEGDMNVMSVSLLRLKDGRIALFYVRKNSTSDCRPYLRYSTDETRTWSEPILCIRESGYFVLNNDRAIQLASGRILLPVALHRSENGDFGSRGVAMTFLSGDAGKTWRRGKTILECPTPDRAGLQEPGVIELKDGRLMMFIRTSLGSQYLSYSTDGGETWSAVQSSSISSPLSPASIKRIPSTGDLLMVWNDHSAVDPSLEKKRTPLTVAISKDDGKTWIHARNLLDDPEGWYCYTAIHFVGKEVLLAFASGGHGLPHLSKMDLARFPVKKLY